MPAGNKRKRSALVMRKYDLEGFDTYLPSGERNGLEIEVQCRELNAFYKATGRMQSKLM